MSKTVEVEMRTSIAGQGWSAKDGDRQLLPKDEAERLIGSNQAVRVDPDGKAQPLEGKPGAPEVYERVISPRERGTRAVTDPDTGELVTVDKEQAERLKAGGRGVPTGERLKAKPEPLDDAETDADADEFEPYTLDEIMDMGIESPGDLKIPENLEGLGLDITNPEHKANVDGLIAEWTKKAEAHDAKVEAEAKAKAEAEAKAKAEAEAKAKKTATPKK